MKQEDCPETFFKKYGFTQSVSKIHPKYKDTIIFTGLEADYVTFLERKITNLEESLHTAMHKIDWLMNKEFYKFQDNMEKNNANNKS